MVFSVYGMGIRDNVTFDKSTMLEVVEQVTATTAVKKVEPKNEEERAEQQNNNLLLKKHAGKAYSDTFQVAKERGIALHAHQIMTSPVVTLFPETTITDAWRLFRERRFRHVPVVTGTGKIYGIISDRDLLRYAATSGKVPPYTEDMPESRTSIENLIKTRVITSSQDTEIRQIARMLFEQRIGAMPVVAENGVVEGIITRSDILRTLVNHAPLELWV